jgi:hypothetical protein
VPHVRHSRNPKEPNMLEDLDLDDLAAIADSFPGPHPWAYGIDDIFVCQADPVRQEPREPVPTDGQTGATGLR